MERTLCGRGPRGPGGRGPVRPPCACGRERDRRGYPQPCIGDTTMARCWRKYLVQPWRGETFRFSTYPELVAKVTRGIDLYPSPLKNAIVLCEDEKSREQSLERIAPILPLRPGPSSHHRLVDHVADVDKGMPITRIHRTTGREIRHHKESTCRVSVPCDSGLGPRHRVPVVRN